MEGSTDAFKLPQASSFLSKKARRALDDFHAKPSFALDLNEDCDSLENNTNLNWYTGKAAKRKQPAKKEALQVAKPEDLLSVVDKKKEQVGEMDVQEFYASSHFYIDQLKEEYFEEQGEGWVQKEEEDQAHEETAQSGRKHPKKWSDDEHQRFLEGLKLFGKDWPNITKHIGTRKIKSVVSHGQKFLVRLIQFLDNKKSKVEELTLEEVQYFHGVLCQRQNRSSLERQRRLQQTQEMKEKGFLFRVQKVKRKPVRPTQPSQPPPPSEVQEEQLSSYEKWKQEVLGNESGSFRGSLGHSVKIAQSSHHRLSFKSKFVLQPEQLEEISDTDSALSQSAKYLQKFGLNETFDYMAMKHFSVTGFLNKIRAALLKLEDVSSPDADVDLIIKISDLFEAKALSIQPIGNFLASISRKDEETVLFQERFPNFSKLARRCLEQRMDNNELSQVYENPIPLEKLVAAAGTRNVQEFIDSLEISFEYRPRKQGGDEGKKPERIFEL